MKELETVFFLLSQIFYFFSFSITWQSFLKKIKKKIKQPMISFLLVLKEKNLLKETYLN